MLGPITYGTLAQTPRSIRSHILSLPGIFAYWPLTETSGTTAYNATGVTGLNGTYYNSPSLASTVFPKSNPVVLFDKVSDCVDIFNTNFPAHFDPTDGWLSLWFKDIGFTGATGSLFYAYADASNKITIDTQSEKIHYISLRSGGGNVYFGTSVSTVWRHIVIAWSNTNGNKAWLDGAPVKLWNNSKNSWLGSLTNLTAIGAVSNGGAGSYNGSIGHVAFGAGNGIPSDKQVETIYNAIVSNYKSIVFAGDSKTYANIWSSIVVGGLTNSTNEVWRIPCYDLGISGARAVTMATAINTNIEKIPVNTSIFIINIGVNDTSSMPTESSWKGYVTASIEALRSRCPNINFYISHIWRRGYATQSATINSWIDDIIASYEYVFAGPDESVWLENGDDGITYTSDGIHYNAAGNLKAAEKWLIALGY